MQAPLLCQTKVDTCKHLTLGWSTCHLLLCKMVTSEEGCRHPNSPVEFQAQKEKILEAQEMERALAKYIESLKEKEEQQRCKASKLKADRESQASLHIIWNLLVHYDEYRCINTCLVAYFTMTLNCDRKETMQFNPIIIQGLGHLEQPQTCFLLDIAASHRSCMEKPPLQQQTKAAVLCMKHKGQKELKAFDHGRSMTHAVAVSRASSLVHRAATHLMSLDTKLWMPKLLAIEDPSNIDSRCGCLPCQLDAPCSG